MKKLTAETLTNLKGGGCFKHLRRMHRDTKRLREDDAVEHFTDYLICMGKI